MCSTYNLFVYIFQNSFKCYVIVVTARVWYVFLSILLVLETAILGPWEVLEKSLNSVLSVCYEPCIYANVA